MLTCSPNFVVTDLRACFDQRHDQHEVISVHQVRLPEQLQIVLHHSLQAAFPSHTALLTFIGLMFVKMPGHMLHRSKGHAGNWCA